MAGADVVVVVVVMAFVVEVDRVVLVVPFVVVVEEPPPGGEPKTGSATYSKCIIDHDSFSPDPDTEVVKLPLSM